MWHPSGVTIQVIAHRGANEEEPEHSLAAFMRALDEGADAVECDVRLTADGTLVCVHDRRVDRTSTGRGVVSSMTLLELQKQDFSGGPSVWRDFEEPAPDPTRTQVLTLQVLLATLLESSPTIGFSIETKHPTRYGAYVERALVDLLEYFGLMRQVADSEPRVRMMSFSPWALRRLHTMAPGTPTVLLMGHVLPWRRDGSLPRGVDIAGISVDYLRAHPEYVERAHLRGAGVHVWTVDTPADVRLCLDLGVEAIISNRPAMVRSMVPPA